MSIQAVAAVLELTGETEPKGLQRLVLLALANHANERGECWPSAATIAAEANATVGRCREAVKDLEAGGYLTRKHNAAPDERIPKDKRPNLYRLTLSTFPQPGTTNGTTRGYHEKLPTGTTSRAARVPPEVVPNHQGTIKEPRRRNPQTVDNAGANQAEHLSRPPAGAIEDDDGNVVAFVQHTDTAPTDSNQARNLEGIANIRDQLKKDGPI